MPVIENFLPDYQSLSPLLFDLLIFLWYYVIQDTKIVLYLCKGYNNA